MKRNLKRSTQGWLEHERRGRDAEAEIELGRLFRALPMPKPSSDLARRTLARLAMDGRFANRPHWAYRWAVSAALAVSGLATVVFSPLLISIVGSRGGANWLVDTAAGLLATAVHRFATGYTLWGTLARVGGTAAEILATPQTLGLMLATVLFGMATFRVLLGLTALERSSNHA